MERIRKPFQGVLNIIHFNWHFYLLSLSIGLLLFLLDNNIQSAIHFLTVTVIIAILASTLISLLVSFYIYDTSSLYKFTWLPDIHATPDIKILNINAGFDETSVLLKHKYGTASLRVFDFYDPARHTEISIERARKAYPPYPNTQRVNTTALPLPNESMHKIFAILSAHEIRNAAERVIFFKELHRSLHSCGELIITEHLRDGANFAAYNIGFFHFYSKKQWLKTFCAAGFKIEKQIKITPFITSFILKKNGYSS